ncbi:chaperone protein dnaJ 11, chloroplastic-like [Cynara cardunculus var. scolymus]|uniref:DnaJ domain-containing protein n=1 Tax=Cynara cardunculus var. scolymus TaxID=59895 RepID=A0A103XYP6_CYNCS|nr:chaperone protein dnaJ 11, chloroplastic-like [Cynara cardunculus var. scolymus]KVH99256.1 DnaJ domain-containing protein [Cynara cardunculus var. scolymus]
MAGTLTTSAGATSFRFLNGDCFSTATSIGSNSRVYIGVRNVPKASLHAVVEEPVMESTKMKPRSLYDVLRVKRNATPSEIKSAYRSLAKRYHPDASDSKQNDDRDFIDIHNAYATLSDPSTRALYDLKLSTGLERRSGGLGRSSEFYSCRRWETDQCW